jgi:ParB family chromosome partitioning protein
MITQIETIKLVHHPLNPRKEVGDIAELAESIKANGIFQNLTVVPTDTYGVYQVVIGHRRLEASILAGLETVPCAVVEMDEQTQLSTMLLENMQRSDLTPFEQAQGIQQCMDFGMTIDDISTKTGFSKSTVRRRVKMLELDQEKVKKAVNATLSDYMNLERITDLERRNALLDFIGDNDFNQKVDRAFYNQESERYRALVIDCLESLDIEFRDNRNWVDNYEFGLSAYSDEEFSEIISKLEKLPNDKQFYYVDGFGMTLISVAQKKVETEEDNEQKILVEKKKDKVSKIKSKFSFYYELRMKFMKDFLSRSISKQIHDDVLKILLKNLLLQNEEIYVRSNSIFPLFNELGINNKFFDEEKLSLEILLAADEKELSKILIAAVYANFEDKDLLPINYNGDYSNYYSDEFNNLYEFIECLGYIKTDEETQLIDGSHDLYKPID